MATSLNLDANAVRFAPKATIYFARRGTDVSSYMKNVMVPIGDEFTALGYTSEDGIELTPTVETNPVNVHQSATPIKYVVNSASATLAFSMMQFDKHTVPVYFGTDFTEGEDGTLVLDLASTPSLAENAIIVEWGDFTESTSGDIPALRSGTKARLIIPRGMLSERQAITLTKADAQSLGVTIQALDYNGSLGTVLMRTADDENPPAPSP